MKKSRIEVSNADMNDEYHPEILGASADRVTSDLKDFAHRAHRGSGRGYRSLSCAHLMKQDIALDMLQISLFGAQA
jgi:hypothetical protein